MSLYFIPILKAFVAFFLVMYGIIYYTNLLNTQKIQNLLANWPTVTLFVSKVITFIQSYRFFIVCTTIYSIKVINWFLTPQSSFSDLIIPTGYYFFSFGIALLYYRTQFEFLQNVPIIGKFLKKKELFYQKIKEFELNISFLEPEEISPEIKQLEKRAIFLKSNFWIFFLVLIVLPYTVTKFFGNLIDFFVIFFIIYTAWLRIKINNLTNKILLQKIETNPENFVRFKVLMIKKNPYLTQKRWAVSFLKEYEKFMYPLEDSVNTIQIRKVFGSKGFAAVKEAVGELNRTEYGLAVAGFLGYTAVNAYNEANSSTDPRISRTGQMVTRFHEGVSTGERDVLDKYRDLRNNSFITPENRHHFVGKNGCLRDENIRVGYHELIGGEEKGHTADTAFKEYLAESRRFKSIQPSTSEIIGSEPIAASAPALDPDFSLNLGEREAQLIKKN
jgi:hypothetical protein